MRGPNPDEIRPEPAAAASPPYYNPQAHHVGASCAVRSPYRASALQGTEAAGSAAAQGASAAPEDGPGVPSSITVGLADEEPARRRVREPKLRENRCCPRFSDEEWADVENAARKLKRKPGGFAAAATLAAARSDDPRAYVADYRDGVEHLMKTNSHLAWIGNNLNQIARHLNAGGTLPADFHAITSQLYRALEQAESAAANLAGR